MTKEQCETLRAWIMAEVDAGNSILIEDERYANQCFEWFLEAVVPDKAVVPNEDEE